MPGGPVPRAGALVLLVCAAPYLLAALAPPVGRTFVGAFLFVEDVYNYLGYAQQAQEGAFVFRSKLTTEPHRPALVNLEWWAAGGLSRALGRRPMLAWRLLGLAAAAAFVALADAWMRRAGLPATHRFASLLLVCFGAGPGGVIAMLQLARATPVDLYTGLFPVIELLANPHFVIGTTLVMAALWCLCQGTRRGTAAGVALAAAAGLTRPYDLVIIVAVRGLAVAVTEPARRWPRLLLPLAALSPVAAYMYWLVHRHPAFGTFQARHFPPPPTLDVLLALAPALALATLSLRGAPREEEARGARAHLWAWVAIGLAVIVLRPVPYALQFLAGIGLPLLALGAVGLSRFRPWVTAAALTALSSTAMLALWRMRAEDGDWFVPSAAVEAARAMGRICRPGDVALAPPPVGLYALALSSCTPFVSHPVMAGYRERRARVEALYAEGKPEERERFLAGERVAVLVVPEGGGYRVCRLDSPVWCP